MRAVALVAMVCSASPAFAAAELKLGRYVG
jgi:hypothetical protein